MTRIIIPIYNAEPYLRQCPDNLLAQTFEDIEIKCINDETTDASGTIQSENARKDNLLKVITQSNSGISANLHADFNETPKNRIAERLIGQGLNECKLLRNTINKIKMIKQVIIT